MSGILFSIIIITRNRAEKIQDVLACLKKIEFPLEQYEVIIVDNGSNDGTAGAAGRLLANTGINYHIEFEPRKGICQARNKGVASAKGEWLLFLDDDVLIQSGLLNIYKKALSKFPSAVAFGGPATLDPAIPRPWWWIAEFDKTMSCQDYGRSYLVYPIGTNPYGLNMLINRLHLLQQKGFDTRLDVLTNSFADETELFMRMRKDGAEIIYVPDAGVIHCVMPDRLEWHNFMKRFHLVGRSHACLDYLHNTSHAKSMVRSMKIALSMFIKHRSPAVFFTEAHMWNGYRQFNTHAARNLKP